MGVEKIAYVGSNEGELTLSVTHRDLIAAIDLMIPQHPIFVIKIPLEEVANQEDGFSYVTQALYTYVYGFFQHSGMPKGDVDALIVAIKTAVSGIAEGDRSDRSGASEGSLLDKINQLELVDTYEAKFPLPEGFTQVVHQKLVTGGIIAGGDSDVRREEARRRSSGEDGGIHQTEVGVLRVSRRLHEGPSASPDPRTARRCRTAAPEELVPFTGGGLAGHEAIRNWVKTNGMTIQKDIPGELVYLDSKQGSRWVVRHHNGMWFRELLIGKTGCRLFQPPIKEVDHARQEGKLSSDHGFEPGVIGAGHHRGSTCLDRGGACSCRGSHPGGDFRVSGRSRTGSSEATTVWTLDARKVVQKLQNLVSPVSGRVSSSLFKRALVHQHTAPKILAPREDARTHLDQEVKNELDADKDPDLVRTKSGAALFRKASNPHEVQWQQPVKRSPNQTQLPKNFQTNGNPTTLKQNYPSARSLIMKFKNQQGKPTSGPMFILVYDFKGRPVGVRSIKSPNWNWLSKKKAAVTVMDQSANFIKTCIGEGFSIVKVHNARTGSIYVIVRVPGSGKQVKVRFGDHPEKVYPVGHTLSGRGADVSVDPATGVTSEQALTLLKTSSEKTASLTLQPGLKLYRGTGEQGIRNVLNTSSVDRCLWLAPEKVVARSYIPVSGIRMNTNLDQLIHPPRVKGAGSDIQEQLGISYANVTYDNNGLRSYQYPPILGQLMKDKPRPERSDYEDANLYYHDADKWRQEQQTLFKAHVREKLRDLGYEPSGDYDDYELKLGFEGGKEVLLPNKNQIGKLFTFEVIQPVKVYDLAEDSDGDLQDPDYRKLGLFKNLESKGYDGVRINDFAQVHGEGNIGHTSIGLFKSGLGKVHVVEEVDSAHPEDFWAEAKVASSCIRNS